MIPERMDEAMADLNNLKDIVNEKLRDVTMTEKQKERVREAVQQKPQQMPQRRRSRYTWPTTAAAAILAVVLLTSSGIPQFRDGNPAATTTVTESVGGSANSSTDSTTAQTTQAIDVASQLEIVALDEGEGGVKADSSFLKLIQKLLHSFWIIITTVILWKLSTELWVKLPVHLL